MADVTVVVDKGDMKRLTKSLAAYPREAPKVLQRAVNRTTNTARVQAVRDIAGDTKLKQSDIFKRGVSNRPITQTRATNAKPEARINVTGRRIPLSRFKAREVKKGVSYNVGQGRKTIKGAFLRTVGVGQHRGVFVRQGKTAYPISEKFGPSLGYIFAESTNMVKDAVKKANKDLTKNIDTQLKLVLEKKQA